MFVIGSSLSKFQVSSYHCVRVKRYCATVYCRARVTWVQVIVPSETYNIQLRCLSHCAWRRNDTATCMFIYYYVTPSHDIFFYNTGFERSLRTDSNCAVCASRERRSGHQDMGISLGNTLPGRIELSVVEWTVSARRRNEVTMRLRALEVIFGDRFLSFDSICVKFSHDTFQLKCRFS